MIFLRLPSLWLPDVYIPQPQITENECHAWNTLGAVPPIDVITTPTGTHDSNFSFPKP